MGPPPQGGGEGEGAREREERGRGRVSERPGAREGNRNGRLEVTTTREREEGKEWSKIASEVLSWLGPDEGVIYKYAMRGEGNGVVLCPVAKQKMGKERGGVGVLR